MFFFFDPLYLLYVLPGFLLALLAKAYVSSSFSKYSKILARSGMTGRDAAKTVLRSGGLHEVRIEPIPGKLSDHFDPRDNTIRLSEPVYGRSSIAAIGVAAHEAGHALQHAAGYAPATIRSAIVPVASLGSGLAMPVFFIGLLLSRAPIGGMLMNVGIMLFGAVALFQLVTLPVEIDASRRAVRALATSGTLAEDEIPGARKVLTAAALTYVAALVQTVMVLLYMLSRRR